MGVDGATAKAWLDTQEAPEPEEFMVWACNWPALHLFLGLKTQWRRLPFGGVVGLEYAGVPAYLKLRGIRKKEWTEVFEKLQAMEIAVLPILNAVSGH